MKGITVCLARVALMLLIAAAVGMHSGKLLGYSLQPAAAEDVLLLAQAQELFESAASFKKEGKTYAVYGADEKLLGNVLDSRGHADKIVGYASSTPVWIGVAEDGRIAGVVLRKNAETPEFVEKALRQGLLASWNDRKTDEALSLKVDAVSGATMTSTAIVGTVRKTLEAQGSTEAAASQASPWDFRALLASAVLACALAHFFFPARTRRFRVVLQLASIAVLGFLLGWFVAMAQLYGWLVHGVPWQAKPVIALMGACALVLPLVTRKAFYCSCLCPFGACQEIAARVPLRKFNIPKWARDLRSMAFAAVVLLLLVGAPVNLADVEPFSAFIPESAATFVVVAALLFLGASLFSKRPWCNTLCPTGQLLEIVRNVAKEPKEDDPECARKPKVKKGDSE
jgi:Na+-translocating ferredoxin:NAD+ oxidoreductase RnfG subunit